MLRPPHLVFVPSLSEDDIGGTARGPSLAGWVDSWIARITGIAQRVARLDWPAADFAGDVAQDAKVRALAESIRTRVADNRMALRAFASSYAAYQELWMFGEEPRMADALSPHAREQSSAQTEQGPTSSEEETLLSLDVGDQRALAWSERELSRWSPSAPLPSTPDLPCQLPHLHRPHCRHPQPRLRLRRLAEEVATLRGGATIGWLRIDACPARQALLTLVTKWLFRYAQRLRRSVVNQLERLDARLEAAQPLGLEVAALLAAREAQKHQH